MLDKHTENISNFAESSTKLVLNSHCFNYSISELWFWNTTASLLCGPPTTHMDLVQQQKISGYRMGFIYIIVLIAVIMLLPDSNIPAGFLTDLPHRYNLLYVINKIYI